MSETVNQQQESQAPEPTQGGGADDAAIIAELEQMEGGQDPDEPPAEQPAEGEQEDGAETDAEATEEEGEPQDSDEGSEEADSEKEGEEEGKTDTESEGESDPELEQRLEKIRRAEKRSKEQIQREREEMRAELDKERQAFQKEREEWQPKVEQFQRMQSRAQYDPAGVLEALGVEPTLEHARAIYARTPEGQKDPRVRDHATRAMQQRETSDELSQLRDEVKKLRQEREQEQQQRQAQQQYSEYLQRVTKAASDDTPIVKRWLSSAPEKANSRLGEMAGQIYRQTGEIPEPQDVVRELEKARRAELEELGIDPAQAIAAPKKQNQNAGEKTKARTISSDLGTPKKPRSEPLSDEELDADILRAMERGEVE